MNALAPIGPPELLASQGVSSRLHEHPDVTCPWEIRAALGAPPRRTAKTFAFITPEDRLLLAARAGTGTRPIAGLPADVSA